MNKFIAKINAYKNRNPEEGSIAAVLAVSIVIGTVTIILAAFSLTSTNAAQSADAQVSMSAGIANVTQTMTNNVAVTGAPQVTAGQVFPYAPISTVVTVQTVTPITVGNNSGSAVTLNASWRSGTRTITQTKQIFYPKGPASTQIISFDANGKAVWG